MNSPIFKVRSLSVFFELPQNQQSVEGSVERLRDKACEDREAEHICNM